MKPHMVFEFLFLAEDNIADRAGLPLLSGVGPLVRVTSPLRVILTLYSLWGNFSTMYTLSLNVISQKLHL